MNIGDVVVHKSIGNQPLVVYSIKDDGFVVVRYSNQTSGGLVFDSVEFRAEELETPEESIVRESELFQFLAAKKKQLQEAENGYKKGPQAVN